MKNKLIIDSVPLLFPLTGIGRYTYEIANLLEEQNHFNINYFYGYYSNNLIKQKKDKHSNLKSIILKSPYLKQLARKVLTISSKFFAPKYDIYWQPNLIPKNGIKAKKIITTVHDFSFILYENYHPKERVNYINKYFYKNIIKSDYIITGSYYSKKEILQRLNFEEDKIKVIYHGVNHNLFKIYHNIKLNFQLPNKFILFVGSIEPRKNLIGLLKSYDLLSQKIKDEYKLVLIGFEGWNNNDILNLINKNKTNIHYLGFLEDIELAQIYNLASLFVFPSFYEGFGLPVLEAMACGTPVLSSNKTSMPEICGDCAIYCNPNNIIDIKNKIELILSDVELQNNLIKKGLIKASSYTWEKSMKEHLILFDKVLKN